MEFRIKEILKDKGMTALQLSNDIGMTQANMSNIMTGKTKPSLDTLERIAVVLGVPFTDLFTQPQDNTVNCPYCGNKIRLEKDGANYTTNTKPRPVINTAPTPPVKAQEGNKEKDEDTPAPPDPVP
ncbi:helix-turn-helix domain-containing protein [Dysgonomonas reticulitermitis]